MSTDHSAAAVIVTFNRLDLLKEGVDALRQQSRPLDDIIVVNNGSTDGTKEWLAEQTDLTVVNQGNTGGAGGFYTGVKTAYEKGHDWIWCMDDDAMPEESAFETLLDAADRHDLPALCPLIVGKDDVTQHWHHKRIQSPGLRESFPIECDQRDQLPEMVPLDANAFVGPLFHRDVVEAVGLPLASMFIWGDDVEYTYRVSREFPFALIPEARIIHSDLGQQKTDVALWKMFFGERNHLFMVKKFEGRLPFYVYALATLLLRIPRVFLTVENRWVRVRLMLKALMEAASENLETQSKEAAERVIGLGTA